MVTWISTFHELIEPLVGVETLKTRRLWVFDLMLCQVCDFQYRGLIWLFGLTEALIIGNCFPCICNVK